MKYLSLFPLCLVLFIQHVQADLIPESPSTLAVTTPLSLAGSAYASFPNPETLSVTNVTKMSEEEMADFLRLQRQQRQTDPKAVFSDRNMTAIEYAIVKCRDCSSAAASKSGAVCFVVYDQKDQDQSLPLRQDLFTKHSHKKTMTKAQRDAKSACYISDSPFVYGRETLETTNRIDGQHSAVFVPLARRTKSRFWSKFFVDRQLFKKLPTAQPMTAEELLMDKARKVETDYVFSPSSFLQWMLHSSEMDGRQKALFAKADAAELFELLAAGLHGQRYAMQPSVVYIPVSELSAGIRQVMPTHVSLERRFQEELKTRSVLQEQIYLFSEAGFGSAKRAMKDPQNAYMILLETRVALAKEQPRVSAYARKPSVLQQQCLVLYKTLRDLLLPVIDDLLEMNIPILKRLLLAEPLVLLSIPPASLQHFTYKVTSASAVETLCRPFDDKECRVRVANIRRNYRLASDLMQQLEMYIELIDKVAKDLFPDQSGFSSAMYPAGREKVAAGALDLKTRSLLPYRPFQMDVAHKSTMLEGKVEEAVHSLTLPKGQSREAQAFFKEWKANISNHWQLRFGIVTLSSLMALLMVPLLIPIGMALGFLLIPIGMALGLLLHI